MTPALQLPPGSEKRAYVSPSRFAPFLRATNNDANTAWALYDWNVEASSAVYEVLHRVEVVLRNAIDLQLRYWNRGQDTGDGAGKYGDDWIEDPSPLLYRLAEREIEEACAWADARRSRGKAVQHDDLVARLTFGAWRYLLWGKDPGRQRLWNEALVHAFPNYAFTAADFERDVEDLYALRNRIAHLEPIYTVRLDMRLQAAKRVLVQAAKRVLGSVHATLESWCADTERVSEILTRKP